METAYKILIHDRNYSDWTIHETLTFQPVEIKHFKNPAEYKLLTNDVFTYDYIKKDVTILHSSTRHSHCIPGVLLLKNTKTYGRKNGKLLYKCVPDDFRIPSFLVPYEMKHVGFSKVYPNMYVTFMFVEWKGGQKHPYGSLTESIGPVDKLDHFYEYLLYCKSLNTSIQKFTKDTSKALKTNSQDAFLENITKKYPTIEDRTSIHVFSIDPPNSLDFDDAFSIQQMDEKTVNLSIYISNVTIWLDVLNLWNSFSRRISTIYLPDKKRPMLPTILSDCLCSLQSGNTRLAFVLDIQINEENGEILSMNYANCKVRLSKNYVYEEEELLQLDQYNQLFSVTKKLSKKYKYLNNIKNSHDVVAYLMIFMNYHSAQDLLSHNNGIFRSTILKPDFHLDLKNVTIPEEVETFIKIWNSSSGKYIDISSLKREGDDGTPLPIQHELLDMDAYVHITSPIRRLVDLLNMIQFQFNHRMIDLSSNSYEFYMKWLGELEYINTTMKMIRRVQNDCSLLHLCTTNEEVMEKNYEGYTFDKIMRNDGLYQYVVYIPELKMVSRITERENIEDYEKHEFKLYLFHDEEKFKKKIRLQRIAR
jgi:exoribonuclease R